MPRQNLPPRVAQAQRFLAQRGWNGRGASRMPARALAAEARARTQASPQTAATAPWQPLGPTAVISVDFGLVTGRVSSIAFDPTDPTGNRIYVGTTGGGVWVSQNAGTSNSSNVVFTPLTDALGALSVARDASISIGALTVQPGGTGVMLAGTGDPNDALDSYYGAGILRSPDGGNTWTLIQATSDQLWAFTGEGFAGFAWSTLNPQLVVAAVSQAYEGTLANAEVPNASYEGLYYSADSGLTWSLARITDPSGTDVQGPADAPAAPDGNAATSVVWNPVRRLFLAAVRYHGYYQSTDGVTWTRLAAQPGAAMTSQMCPPNPGSTGSVACPIFRGTLAVNPLTGDTFAWTVDANNQDQGIWQDQCAISAGACTNQNITFAKQWNSSPLETNTSLGATTIANGDYNLALTAVASGQDTLLLAGANDLWKCSLAMGCAWRNTTNATTCMSAQVAGYQHALAWNTNNPLELFVGNDSGLWRSEDAIAESGPVCSAGDATHFQNLNSGLGSLAEVVSMSQVTTSPYTMMTGLGVNGTAGVKSLSAPTSQWPQILGGEGGVVAVDPTDSANWYVNNQAGVSIYLCSQASACTPSAFGTTAVVTDADLGGDGYIMTSPAPFLVDPLDATRLLVGTCRVWRGPANGSGWSGANAISPFLDGLTGNGYCDGDALIRAMAAMALPNGDEVIYAGMYGASDGGASLAGHLFRATFVPGANSMPLWQDVALDPVTNDTLPMNAFGLDISSIYIDSHDATGNTVYVTIEGAPNPTQDVRTLYRSTDGGAHWAFISSNLPPSPANSLVIDPQDQETAYIATDAGVYSTRQVGTCTIPASNCWSAYGSGLPESPVVSLSAAPTTASLHVLAAATYGRGVWQIPLWTAGVQLTSVDINPVSLTFPSQAYGVASSPQTLILTNTGGVALTPTAISISGDFSETDNCQNTSVNAGASCTIQVTFMPTQAGGRTGQLSISANIAGGQTTVALSGTGQNPGPVVLSPLTVAFGTAVVGATSDPLQVTVQNSNAAAVPVTSVSVSAPFQLATNACGSSLAANSNCQLTIEFAPSQPGAASGSLTVVDGAGTQTVALTGTGAAPATDTLSPTTLTFPGTIIGLASSAMTVSLTNSGGVPLTSIGESVSGPFQISSNCTAQLAGNASCSVSVVFAPTAAGLQTGTLTVSDISRTQPQVIALSGIGLLPPVITTSPATLSFPAQQLSMASTSAMLTVSNTGGAPMANVGFQISGQSAASFSTTATTCGATLANGSSCTVQVVFTPTVSGGNLATLTVSSSTLGVKAVQVALSGAGQAGSGINVSPPQMAFTVGTLGQPSAAQTATISNSSASSAANLALAVAAPFSLAQSTCGTSLAGGANCSVAVIFTPTVNGVVAGSLTVTSSTLNSAVTLLTGTGGAAGVVQVQPALLSFPATGVGATSSAQTVTLTNTGTIPLSSLAITVSSGFTLASTTCGPALAPGASCTAAVAFVPANAGPQTGSLTIASSALAANAQASLSGLGFDFTATSSGVTSQTVSSGQTASYALVLTPLAGASGSFTFACGSLPANSTCTFNPSTEMVAAGTTGYVTVQVATGSSVTIGRVSEHPGWGVVPLLCGLLLLPFACWRKQKILVFLAALAILAGGISGCSGSGGGTSGTGSSSGEGKISTPPGTYSIPVTATSNGVSHQVTLTLTVD